MTLYVRNHSKKGKTTDIPRRELMEGETLNLHLQNTIRIVVEEMLAVHNKPPEEQPITRPVTQPEKATKVSEQIVIQKLSRFKKFAPPSFQEAKTPMEAEDWLDKLKKILDLLQAEDNDRIMLLNFS